MVITKSSRNFKLLKFKDFYQQECSLQESSSTEAALWLGVDNTGPHLRGPEGGYNEAVQARMLLTKSQIRQLIPFLENFIRQEALWDDRCAQHVCKYPRATLTSLSKEQLVLVTQAEGLEVSDGVTKTALVERLALLNLGE